MKSMRINVKHWLCGTVLHTVYNNIGSIADNMPQYAHVAYFSISV